MNDAGNTVHGHIDLARKLRGRDAEFPQLFSQMLARMNGCTRQDGHPSVIIDDFYVHGTARSIGPRKTDTPLIVYSDRELPGAVTPKRLEPVARQSRQIGKAGRGLKPVEAHLSLPGKTREFLDVPPGRKPFGRLVPITDDHGRKINSRNYGLRK